MPGPTADAKQALPPAVQIDGVSLHYGTVQALAAVSLDIPAGRMVGLIGADGVGKSSLLSLIAGVHVIQKGTILALGGDMADRRHRENVCARIAYMPQGLGKNLYATLSVEENLQFFARLFGHDAAERRRRIDTLTQRTGLYAFLDRPTGKLSGGMKQKLGLCCALIHDPDLLILDEPTTGVDPLARSQFWSLINDVRAERDGMSVIVATAYMDEAKNFDWLVAMHAGNILTTGAPADILAHAHASTLEEAFIQLMPADARKGYAPVVLTPLNMDAHPEIAIEAKNLSKRFGNFTAVDDVSFSIRRGEIFGFLGSNGCGKTTTMKMLTGLLPATEGTVHLFGKEVHPNDIATRKRLGYMTQSFSLYNELSVEQNLVLHARLFGIAASEIAGRVQNMLARFGLEDARHSLPENLPLGVRQRLSLAASVIHKPEILILDEPTSGVDPIARDGFWRLLIELSRQDRVTIFISTHFMNEAERCDRISLMSAGKVMVSDAPASIVEQRRAVALPGSPSGTLPADTPYTLEDAFISYLKEAEAAEGEATGTPKGDATRRDAAGGGAGVAAHAQKDSSARAPKASRAPDAAPVRERLSPTRFWACVWRESLELARDPIRSTLALGGALILMLVMGYGITMDVEDLSYAMLDRDQSGLSQNYSLSLSGSRYFTEHPPCIDYADIDARMRSGEISLAVEIPPNFGRDVARGTPVAIGVWIDGAMPQRAETIKGYVLGMHQVWLSEQATRQGLALTGAATVEIRYRYNPDVKSLRSMVPAVIPLLLLMLPSMLAALAVVREKELGSIINLYTTPLTRTEFMLGKQIPYIVLAMASFLLMVVLAVTLFDVPVKGSFLTLCLAALIFSTISTGIGLFISTFMRSQVAVMFVTMLSTMLPAIQFSGLINTVSSLEGAGRVIGELYPATYMLIITRGVFNKGLGFFELSNSIGMLAITVPVILTASIVLLKKQAR